VAPAIRTLIKRCLAKDRKQRMRDIGDVQLVLNGAFESPVQPAAVAITAPHQRSRRRVIAGASIGLTTGIVLLALAVWTGTTLIPERVL
jgi:hypothetical protein